MPKDRITVVGPLATRQEAIDTMNALGYKNHSYYGEAKDKIDPETGEEYTDHDDCLWYVERLLNVVPDTIFGRPLAEIERMQGGKLR